MIHKGARSSPEAGTGRRGRESEREKAQKKMRGLQLILGYTDFYSYSTLTYEGGKSKEVNLDSTQPHQL